jgi:hypothetical protein
MSKFTTEIPELSMTCEHGNGFDIKMKSPDSLFKIIAYEFFCTAGCAFGSSGKEPGDYAVIVKGGTKEDFEKEPAKYTSPMENK